jgi:hypothetical protein
MEMTESERRNGSLMLYIIGNLECHECFKGERTFQFPSILISRARIREVGSVGPIVMLSRESADVWEGSAGGEIKDGPQVVPVAKCTKYRGS